MTAPKQASEAPSAPPKHAPNLVHVTWRGDHRFDAGRPGGPAVRIDADTKEGPSPVDALLAALATCVSVDVVDILRKRRTPVAALEIEVVGTRVESIPRRLRHVLLRFHITGAGIEHDQALRAVELAVTKYCSVRDSLDPNLPVEWEVHVDSGT